MRLIVSRFHTVSLHSNRKEKRRLTVFCNSSLIHIVNINIIVPSIFYNPIHPTNIVRGVFPSSL